MKERLKRRDQASTAPNKKRLSLCLHGPAFCYYGPEKPHRPVGGFSGPQGKAGGEVVGGGILKSPQPNDLSASN